MQVTRHWYRRSLVKSKPIWVLLTMMLQHQKLREKLEILWKLGSEILDSIESENEFLAEIELTDEFNGDLDKRKNAVPVATKQSTTVKDMSYVKSTLGASQVNLSGVRVLGDRWDSFSVRLSFDVHHISDAADKGAAYQVQHCLYHLEGLLSCRSAHTILHFFQDTISETVC